MNNHELRPEILRAQKRLAATVLAFLFALGATHAAIVVNSAADPAGFNPGITIETLGATVTLRDAINAAVNAGGNQTITFDPALAGQTISLSQVQSTSAGNSAFATEVPGLVIQGLTNGNGITISGGNSLRPFFITGGDLTLNDLTVTQGKGNFGGAIYAIGNVLAQRCTFTGNNATSQGGALVTSAASKATVINCTFTGNYAAISGGGIENGATLVLVNTTIVSNSIGVNPGVPAVAGGLENEMSSSATLTNTIVAANTYLGAPADVNGYGPLDSASRNNLIGVGGSGGLVDGVNGNIVDVDPSALYLGPLINNGGPTPTISLELQSPALNAGISIPSVTTDQRGLPRTFRQPDIGAYEVQQSVIVVNSTADPAGFNSSITIPTLGSTVTLRDALNAANNTSGADTITFDPSLAGQIVYLTNVQSTLQGPSAVIISSSITIQGLTGNNGVTISAAGGNTRHFQMNGGSLTLNNLTLSGGAPGNASGGVIYTLGGTVIANACTFQNNNCVSGGAIGLDYSGATVSLANCTFSQNSATYGGAIAIGDPVATVTLRNVTIVGNSAGQLGGGILRSYGTGSLLMTNTIVAGNSAAVNGADIYGPVSGGAYNLIGSSASMSGIANGVNGNIVVGSDPYNSPSPGLGALANNGGPTATMLPQVTSAVFNAGTADAAVTTDQRGVPRSQGSSPDIGAVELQYQAPVITSATNTLFLLAQNNNFTFTSTGVPAPTYLFTGTLPDGVTLSASGILSGTPATAGVYPITVTASNGQLPNGTQNFTLSVREAPSLVVTTTNDVVNDLDGVTSLREALIYAQTLLGSQTITFDPELAGQSVILHNGWTGNSDSSALVVTGDITLQGLNSSPGVVIAMDPAVQRRHLYVSNGASLTLANLTFTGGHAPDFGGSVWNQLGSLTVRGCTFTGNYAESEGGAIQVWGGSPSFLIENSTISGNSSANIAGAMDIGASSSTLCNVTITDNSAVYGNAVVFFQYSVTATNTLIARNPNGDVGSVAGGAFNTSASFNNLIGTGGSAGLVNGVNGNQVGVASSDLFIGSLANNGGPTPTIALSVFSPAVNAGISVSGLTTDQRGLSRAFRQPDIGAYEFQSSIIVVNSTNDPAGFNPSITVPALGSTVTLRDAVNAARNSAGNQIITFDPSLAGKTILLSQQGEGTGPSALVTGANNGPQNNLLIQGLTNSPGITIAVAPGTPNMRIFFCSGSSSTFTLNDVTLTNGNVLPSGWGGAIVNAQENITLNRCSVLGCSANFGGAIYNGFGGVVTLQSCTLAGNFATNQGGAFYQVQGGVSGSMINCTITDNSSQQAGGIFCGNGYLLLVNSIIASNHAPYGYSEIVGDAYIHPASHNNLCSAPGTIPGTANGAGGMHNGVNGNITGANPKLGALGNYGGPTPTFPLLAGSPAINAGAAVSAITDQRGVPFFGSPDLGAFEYQGPSVTSPNNATFLTGLQNTFTLSATGAIAPTILIAGTLPSDVSFYPPGTLSGTPPDGSGGVYPLTVIASNGVAPNATQNFTLNVVERSVFAAHPNFKTNGLGWALNGDSINGGPNISNNVFTLTDGTGGENRSAWFRYPLYVGAFQASFTYQDVGGNGADGVAFVIQNDPSGPNALGGGGGGLGYYGISPSVAVMLNIYAGALGGPSGVLVATNGMIAGAGYWPTIYQNTAPVNLDGGDAVAVNLRYVNGNLNIKLTDTVTSATYETNVTISIPAFTGTNVAYVGITGSEGGVLSHQIVRDFSYTPIPIVNISGGDSNSLVFTWPESVYGFTLEASSDLTNPAGWSAVSANVLQTNGVNQLMIPTPADTRFYRLVLH